MCFNNCIVNKTLKQKLLTNIYDFLQSEPPSHLFLGNLLTRNVITINYNKQNANFVHLIT